MAAFTYGRKKFYCAVAVVVFCTTFYMLTCKIQFRPEVVLTPTALDRSIPYLSWTVTIYISYFVLIFLPILVCSKQEQHTSTSHHQRLKKRPPQAGKPKNKNCIKKLARSLSTPGLTTTRPAQTKLNRWPPPQASGGGVFEIKKRTGAVTNSRPALQLVYFSFCACSQ